MDDVKPTATAPVQQDMEAPSSGGVNTPSQIPQADNQTPVAKTAATQPEVVTPPVEKSIPYSRFSEVNAKKRELERELARLKSEGQLRGESPETLEQIMSNPIVQKLLINEAKREVTDYAKEYLDAFPNFPAAVKKAILRNVRGFIKEDTTDPETAKLDVAEYIDEVAADLEKENPATIPGQKGFPIGPTNTRTVPQNTGTRPADIGKILDKPVNEWTEEDTAKVEAYSKTVK